jgi:4-nitrophenyl phosphatase
VSLRIDLTSYQAVLLDLDGTVYHGEQALPGAVELIARLRARGARYACLSNSTSTPSHLVPRLDRMGIPIDAAHIYTAAAAACDYVLERFGPRPRIYNLATEGVHDDLDGRVVWVQESSDPCDAVIVGTLTSALATEQRLRTALAILRRQRAATLVGICADRVYPSQRGIEFGSGALTNLFAYACDVTPVFTGKPQRIFFEKLCQRLDVSPQRCVLIGDNLESDIAGASAVGMPTVLALSGVTHREDLERLSADRRPRHVITDLRDLL